MLALRLIQGNGINHLRNNGYLIYNLTSFRYYGKDCPMSDKQKSALKKSWCEIEKDPACYGLAFFRDLFKKHPGYVKLFEKYGDCPDDILKNDKFVKKHVVKNVMGTIGQFIKKIDDPCAAKSMAKKLGKKHIKYCVKKEHFKNGQKILIKSFKYNLGDKWNKDAEAAWKYTAKMLFKSLSKGLKQKC